LIIHPQNNGILSRKYRFLAAAIERPYTFAAGPNSLIHKVYKKTCTASKGLVSKVKALLYETKL
jgi:hypothetical protein